ncbi:MULTISPECIES: Rv3654c family TadE-like protein [Gordonia]|uniref:Rv3654c family TadE-like protein n=1 Tax=Gordonia TaxID=2053 RepID=UPI0007EA6394|nr:MULTISPECIES: Rv3654c family TadE-like protein [Gordonia]MCM3895089.1 pilus assembly protein TadG-related protein [Gordonia sputi]OBA42741.1 hypothetical protein A5766_18465 [Gordonia sp. 852002-51296_SCH5728562-b]OBA65354.1 hypothetical protein A5777_20665 [Gordonia sp. 852002-10350_SCH5691597]
MTCRRSGGARTQRDSRFTRLLRDEGGYATVAAAGAIAGIAALIVLVIYVGAATLARHRAQSAADLAALAAAADHVAARADPCATAKSLTAEQRPRAEVFECAVVGEDVVVGVRVSVSLGALGVRAASARARAGPAEGP